MQSIFSSAGDISENSGKSIRMAYGRVMAKLAQFANREGQIRACANHEIYEAPDTFLILPLISSFLIRTRWIDRFVSIDGSGNRPILAYPIFPKDLSGILRLFND